MSLYGIIANCLLPYEKATPSILAIEVWLMMLHVGWENPILLEGELRLAGCCIPPK